MVSESPSASMEPEKFYPDPDLFHAGVGLEGNRGKITKIVGRVASPPVAGDWCLFCGGIIDPELAGKESGDPEHLMMWKEKGISEILRIPQ